MPVIVMPIDFDRRKYGEALIKIIRGNYEDPPVLCKNAVPLDFYTFSGSKGYKLDVRKPISGDQLYGEWHIEIASVDNWNIEICDTVRDKKRILNHGMNIDVINGFEGVVK